MIEASTSSAIDTGEIEKFLHVTQSRDRIYNVLDSMCEDPTLAAVLEAYAEDSTEYGDNGRIVWVESSDSDVVSFVTFLLDTMQVDKNIYGWTHSLCKYGDVYLKLFRQSEVEQDSLFQQRGAKKPLKEDTKIIAHSEKDHYTHYVEAVPNPAEMFELTKLGKTYAYIKADSMALGMNYNQGLGVPTETSPLLQNAYRFKKNDVTICPATDYVHGALFDDSNRIPEEVHIFRDAKTLDSNKNALTYTVRRGQSIYYSVYKIWRIISLLQNSILLSRLTKSAITRLINVEVGDMPKEDVQRLLMRIKSLMEQKTSLNTGATTGEYTNPGPIENIVYVPSHGGQGNITSTEIGGDFDAGQLTDLDYFNNLLFGALQVPKQFFGFTDDSAGFSGGESLAQISSGYAKRIKRIQKTLITMITDALNLMLLDKGLGSYIGKFQIRMQAPTTKEETDRQANISNQIGLIRDVMGELQEVQNPIIKQKILKNLLSKVVTDQEVIQLLQDNIEEMEEGEQPAEENATEEEPMFGEEPIGGSDFGSGEEMNFGEESTDLASDLGLEGAETEESSSEEVILPTPEQLGVDMTDNTAEEQ